VGCLPLNLSLNRLTRRLKTIRKKSNERMSQKLGCYTDELLEIRVLNRKLCSRKRELNSSSVFQKSSQIQQQSERKTRVKLIQLLVKIVKRETQDYAPSRRRGTNTTNSQTYSHNFRKTPLNLLTVTFLNCRLKVNSEKPLLINRLWNDKKGERLTISASSFTKIGCISNHDHDAEDDADLKKNLYFTSEIRDYLDLLGTPIALQTCLS